MNFHSDLFLYLRILFFKQFNIILLHFAEFKDLLRERNNN